LIDNEAIAGCEVACAEQFACRCIALDGETFDFQREFERVADGQVVIPSGGA
jgi:hypothetical protein